MEKLWQPAGFLARINRLTNIVDGQVVVREDADDFDPNETAPAIESPAFVWTDPIFLIVEGPCSNPPELLETDPKPFVRLLKSVLGTDPATVLVYATCCGDYPKTQRTGWTAPPDFRELLAMEMKNIKWLLPSMPDLRTCFLRRNDPTLEGVEALLEAGILKSV
jgi:hypothetical protein